MRVARLISVVLFSSLFFIVLPLSSAEAEGVDVCSTLSAKIDDLSAKKEDLNLQKEENDIKSEQANVKLSEAKTKLKESLEALKASKGQDREAKRAALREYGLAKKNYAVAKVERLRLKAISILIYRETVKIKSQMVIAERAYDLYGCTGS